MEKLEEEVRYMLLDVVEGEGVVEMSRLRRCRPGNRVQAMTDSVQEELEKEPAMNRICHDPMMMVLRIVGDS